MKKLLLFIIVLTTSGVLFGQKKGMWSIQESNIIGSFEKDFGCNIFEAKADYMWNLTKIFHLGIGAGIGISNPVKYHSMWKIDSERREQTFHFPIFAKAKLDFSTKPTHMFASLEIGKRITSVENYGGEDFNPFLLNLSPTIGVDIDIANRYKLFFAAGIDINLSKYDEINLKYSDLLKKYQYDSHKYDNNSWTGVVFKIGFRF